MTSPPVGPGHIAGCFSCDVNKRPDLPPRERVWVSTHWRVVHAFNSALPGSHATDRTKELRQADPGRPMGDPADFGKVVAFLCSEPAKFISGTTVSVDGSAIVGLL